MASKTMQLKVTMDNLPIGAGENEVVAEVLAMLKEQYADGVMISVALADQPKKKDS